MQRNSAGEADGEAALMSIAAIYDVAGQIRSAFVELQDQVRTAMGVDDAQGR